jgi:hypothetical protein
MTLKHGSSSQMESLTLHHGWELANVGVMGTLGVSGCITCLVPKSLESVTKVSWDS